MDLGPLTLPAVFASAFVASAVNAVAGGGTFITFPTLTGVAHLSEKVANMTSTVGLWPGSVSALHPALPDLKRIPRPMLLSFTILSLLGGAAGAFLLLHTSEQSFRLVVPWLLAFATTVFAFSKPIGRWALRHHGHRTPGWTALVALIQLLIAVYGGYFGAGIGILMMAGLTFTGLEDIHLINSFKTLLATIINGVGAALFILFSLTGRGSIDWPFASTMILGALLGGFLGMKFIRRVPPQTLRALILSIATLLTAVYFYKAYLA
jgi:uncharacterized membrane protein YfcA